MGVRQVADGLHVGEVSVDVRHQGDRDQLGVVVDGVLHVAKVNLPIPMFDHAKVEAFPLPHFVVVERRGVMQVVGDDVAARQRVAHAVEQVAFGFDGAAREGDLLGLGVDQPCEQVLCFGTRLGPRRPPRLADVVGRPVDVAMKRGRGMNAQPGETMRSRNRRRFSLSENRRAPPRSRAFPNPRMRARPLWPRMPPMWRRSRIDVDSWHVAPKGQYVQAGRAGQRHPDSNRNFRFGHPAHTGYKTCSPEREKFLPDGSRGGGAKRSNSLF